MEMSIEAIVAIAEYEKEIEKVRKALRRIFEFTDKGVLIKPWNNEKAFEIIKRFIEEKNGKRRGKRY